MSDIDGTTTPPPPPAVGPSAEEKQWAMFAHLSALVGGILTSGWAGSIGCFIGPLVIWLIKKDTMPFAADQAKEALNFNITMTIAGIVCFLLTFVLIGLILAPILGIAWLVLTVMACIKANNGEAYRYPFALRLIS